MKPVCKVCGNTRPDQCNQTVFGMNVEIRNGVPVIHGEFKTQKKVS